MPRLLVFAALLLTVAACDSTDSLLGEFVGRVTVGDASRPVEGEAVYTVVETADGPEFVLGLFVGDLFDSDREDYDYVLFRRWGGVPGPGGYAVDDDPTRAFGATIAAVEDADEPLDATGAVLAGVDGTLAITSVDSYGFMAGTYRFTAEGLALGAPGRTVQGAASGVFEARYERPEVFARIGL
ncbi:hypothetical protein [Rubrivirga sp. IMCC45206]|uniref:hypothetical protein n=1 Tax=Rubrivirga sp. IMCC45206 TaxID=3391614 RepID=UPI00398FBABC